MSKPNSLAVDSWEFVCAVFRHWVTLATGGAITALVWLGFGVLGHTPPAWLNLTLAIVFLGIASFKAWRDKETESARLRRQNEPQRILDGMADLVRRGVELRTRIGNNLLEGIANLEEITVAANQWANDTKAHLLNEIGEFAVVEFESQQYSAVGVNVSEEAKRAMVIRSFVNSRVLGLEEVVKHVREQNKSPL